jgi:hypothetical protein
VYDSFALAALGGLGIQPEGWAFNNGSLHIRYGSGLNLVHQITIILDCQL